MPMSPIQVMRTVRPSIEVANSLALKAMGSQTTEAPALGTFQIVSLSLLEVVEGVFRSDTISSLDELSLGDEFQIPTTEDHFETRGHTAAGGDTIELVKGSRFGPTQFDATVTHTVVFMSETGKLVTGCVLDRGRTSTRQPSIVFREAYDHTSTYTLIELTAVQKAPSWFGNLDGIPRAPLPGANFPPELGQKAAS